MNFEGWNRTRHSWNPPGPKRSPQRFPQRFPQMSPWSPLAPLVWVWFRSRKSPNRDSRKPRKPTPLRPFAAATPHQLPERSSPRTYTGLTGHSLTLGNLLGNLWGPKAHKTLCGLGAKLKSSKTDDVGYQNELKAGIGPGIAGNPLAPRGPPRGSPRGSLRCYS